MKRDALGTAMKAFEAAACPADLSADVPIYARIDGRGFSRFTRGMARPFDPAMTALMRTTAQDLLEETGAVYAFTQSDEISLVWAPGDAATEALFGGRVIKTVSVLAGMATAFFTRALLRPGSGLESYADRCPHFDARVCQMPDEKSTADMIAWRGMDAERNAVQMAAQAHFSHKHLQGVRIRDQKALLSGVGITIEDYPGAFRNGTQMSRVRVHRTLTRDERERIPARHRPAPDTPVLRSETRLFDVVPPHRTDALAQRIFHKDATGAPVARPGLRRAA